MPGFIKSFRFCGVFAVYFLTAYLGLKVDAVAGFASSVWAPSGIAVAVLFLSNFKYWPSIMLGAFAVNYISGAPVWVSLCIAIGNTSEVAAAVYFLKRRDFQKTFGRLKDVANFVILACVLSPVISASIGVLALSLHGVSAPEGVFVIWKTWWLGDCLGILVVAPLIFVWSDAKGPVDFKLWRVLEAGALSILVLVAGFVVFGDTTSMPFWFFPLTVWAAVRFGQRGIAFFIFAISAIAVSGTARGVGPLVHGSFRHAMDLLNSFIMVISTTGMTLAASVAERKTALRIRDDFLSIASHELKTPVTSLSLQIQMTKKKLKISEKNLSFDTFSRFFEISEKQILRLVDLIDDLLDATRIHSGKFSFNFKTENLSHLVQDMADRYRDQFREANIESETVVTENLMGEVDAVRMEQVIDNLLSNVVKYAPGKKARVTLESTGTSAVLTVQDSGAGVSMAARSKIFERFERVSTSGVSGLGLGLFIVKEIIKAHKGTINVHTGENGGAKFIAEIPLKH